MNKTSSLSGAKNDESLQAELAAATYRVAKRHGFHAALIDIELDLWDLAKEKQIASLVSRTEEVSTVRRDTTAG